MRCIIFKFRMVLVSPISGLPDHRGWGAKLQQRRKKLPSDQFVAKVDFRRARLTRTNYKWIMTTANPIHAAMPIAAKSSKSLPIELHHFD